MFPRFKKSILYLAASFSLLMACNGPMLITPQPKPSINAANIKQPPSIPEFPSQGPLPSGNSNSNGGTRTALGEALSAPMAPGMMDGAPAPMPASAGGASSDMAGSESSVAKPGAPMSPIDPSMPDIGIMPTEPQVRPEAGLLTAGEWDDLKNWDFWLGLTREDQWSTHLETWGFYTTQRVQVRLEGPSGPMADTPVQLIDPVSQKVIFDARTNNKGDAYLFAHLLRDSQNRQTQSTNKFQIKANLGQDSLTQDVDLSQDSYVKLKADFDLAPAVDADMMLMVDTTGSMGDEMEYLKKEMQNVAERILKQNRDEQAQDQQNPLVSDDLTLRLSANFYKDLTDQYVVKPNPFTEDVSTIIKQLSAEQASGGGDFPEAVDYALSNAIDEHKWSSTARARLLFLVLDAPAHQTPDVLKRLQTSVARAAAKGIRIIPIASSGIDKETEFLLRAMAIATGGRYVFLTDDSGIGGGHIKPTVGKFQVEKLNDLMVRIANEFITGKFTKITTDPSSEPTVKPTVKPTAEPSAEPTVQPTIEPTVEPSLEPTPEPTVEPTVEPSLEPSAEPSITA